MTAAVLTIDLAALAANYRLLKSQVGPLCAVAGVVKANAYGIGLAPVVDALEGEDCPLYFVATLDEGIALRALTARPVAVLNGAHGASEIALAHQLTPVLNSLTAVDEWTARGGGAPAILHVDTGMNRLGLGSDESARLLKDKTRLGSVKLISVMSHFACADEVSPLNDRQMARFAAIRAALPHMPASLANSAGIFLGPGTHYDMVRPGMALYGLNPTPGRPNPMRPVVRLETPILQIRDAQAGESVGYGASCILERDTRLATVALGYADGFLRSGSNRAALYHRGRACPIRGRVSMDLTIVEVDDAAAQTGDMLEVIGPHQDADALAAAAGTIGYEILTSLGSRYRRTYLA